MPYLPKASSHQCYIQPIPLEEDDPKLKKVEANEVGTPSFIADKD